MDRFKLRIFQVDSYLMKPYHVDRILLGKKFNRFDDKQQTRNVKNVTVIRLFGSTPDGLFLPSLPITYLPILSRHQNMLACSSLLLAFEHSQG